MANVSDGSGAVIAGFAIDGIHEPPAASQLRAEPQTPSILRYAPSLVLLVIVIADMGQVADPDLWGHIFCGNLFLHHGPYLGGEPFSYSAPGHRWLQHECLSEVMLALVYDCFGVVGLKILKLAFSAVTIGFIALAEAETGAAIGVQFLVLVAAAIALAPFDQYRPQVVSFALFAILLYQLTRDNFGRRSRLWISIPTLALWANLHGGFVMGLAALGIYTVVRGVQDLSSGKGASRGMRLGLITAASAVATLATPYGIGTWYTVWHSMSNPITRNVMADWRPLMVVIIEQWSKPHGGVILLVAAILMFAATVLSVIATPSRDDAAFVSLAAVIAVSSFMAVRNTAFAVLATCIPLTFHLGLIVQRLRTRMHLDEIAATRRSLRPQSQLVIAALAMFLIFEGGVMSPKLAAGDQYPSGAVAFMKEKSLSGNVLNFFTWGQYLIWHAFPSSRIFIDGRFDLAYPPKVVSDYLDFFGARPGALRVLAAYPHDFVLIPPSAPAFTLMARTPQWKMIYRDKDSVLFARTDSPAARAAAAPLVGKTPNSYFP